MRSLLIAAAAAGALLTVPALAQTAAAASTQTQAGQPQTAPLTQDFSAQRHWRHRHWRWGRPWGPPPWRWRHRHWHRW